MDLEIQIGQMSEQETAILRDLLQIKTFRKWVGTFDGRIQAVLSGAYDPLEAKVYAKVVIALGGLILKAVEEVTK